MDEDYTLTDELTHLTMDEYSYDTRESGGLVSAQRTGNGSTTKRGNLRSSNKSKPTIFGSTDMGCPYIIDKWYDTILQCRISVQIQLLSGIDVHKMVGVRVSSDQWSLVLSMRMSPYFARPEFAFNSYLIPARPPSSSGEEPQHMAMLLNNHPKFIARKLSVAKIRDKGDSMKDVFYEQRIPLPRKCHHKFAEKVGDMFFSGEKFIKYADGSVHLHVELVAVSSNPSKASKQPPNLVQASSIPMSVSVDGGANPNVAGQPGMHDAHSTTMGSTTMMNEQESNKAIILQGGFEGVACRSTRSIKSVKRTADNQDDGQLSGISGAWGTTDDDL